MYVIGPYMYIYIYIYIYTSVDPQLYSCGVKSTESTDDPIGWFLIGTVGPG